MSMEHTKGKLKLGRDRVDDLNQFRIVGDDGFSVFGVVHRAGIYRDTDDPARDRFTQSADGQPEAWANARRLVTCWNACDTVSTEFLEQLAALPDNAIASYEALKAQRDELLAGLENAFFALGRCGGNTLRSAYRKDWEAARALLAKHSNKGASHG